MSNFMSLIGRNTLGQGNKLEDSNPVPMAFRQTPEAVAGTVEKSKEVKQTVPQPL